MADPVGKRGPALRPGDRVRLEVEALVGGGEGLGRTDGMAVFVPLSVPGDVVEARVISTKPGYARALVEAVVQPSPDRVQPPCPVFGRCGGCQWQVVAADAQLRWKTALVAEALTRLGGLEAASVLRPCLPSPEPWHYRNKVHWAVTRDAEGWRVGLYEPRSHAIVEAEACAIQHPLLTRAQDAVRALLTEFDPPPYDEQRGTGFLRSAFAKVGHRTGEVMLGLVARKPELRREKEWIAAARRLLPELTTFVLNVNPGSGNKLLGAETRTLFGPGAIVESLGAGLRLTISPLSFFQVNGAAVEVLYEEVVRACDLPGEPAAEGPRWVDAYGGTGAIALYLAARGAGHVTGLEVVGAATADARANAAANGLAGRTTFHTGRVETLLPGLIARGERPDGVVLDPPRKGCEPAVLEALLAAAPRRVVYVSCNPATLARDLRVLVAGGYRLTHVQPVDMFPQTSHVECVARLERA
ncbi:MAG: 23S rRNA (uracil(1939)-C(5))-methyltransferase RlmD [Candidatus Sericytochromatia bacterium]|nr:23S rRNA (uracil(1939)-C(5))-methyltransferase RlmD [Candidatus Sericytochromatia bacterium]